MGACLRGDEETGEAVTTCRDARVVAVVVIVVLVVVVTVVVDGASGVIEKGARVDLYKLLSSSDEGSSSLEVSSALL